MWYSLCVLVYRGLLSVPGKVVDMPVVFNDRCLRLTVQNTVEFPQLHVDVSWRSSSTVVDVLVLMQRRGTGPPCCNDSSSGPDSAELSGGIQVQFFFTETGVAVQTVQKTGDSVVQFGMVVDMPVGVTTTGYGSDSTENGGVVQRCRT